MFTNVIKVQSSSMFSCHPVTEKIQNFLDTSQQLEGVVCAFCQHSTVGMIVNEMEERLILDLGKWLEEMAPIAQGYKHDDLHLRENIPADEPKNAHSHLRALLLGNHVSVPFKDGKLQLGKYQDIIMVELDGPKERSIVISIQ
ncbi:secondary thiamine-phosphate synthase enzyme YjbQ [Prochlorococcus marinus]|uniref:secondary thiamine-phosphate synthase enzyme YjbQ n=1 Tax=Prochlorococcus marinus TaxID=1219 RepID=UPI0022B2B493|nr:secondary thiamine-phosphate synthase enzyme YjbQ [Prochlorococcus marinus]